MSIVNCRVKFIRPEYQNLEKWMNDEKNVYIGRAGIVFINGKRFPESSSPFCNPYKIGKDGTRQEVIEKYKIYIKNKCDSDPELIKQLLKLEGKNLGCWCAPAPCHGNVLLELIKEYSLKQ